MFRTMHHETGIRYEYIIYLQLEPEGARLEVINVNTGYLSNFSGNTQTWNIEQDRSTTLIVYTDSHPEATKSPYECTGLLHLPFANLQVRTETLPNNKSAVIPREAIGMQAYVKDIKLDKTTVAIVAEEWDDAKEVINHILQNYVFVGNDAHHYLTAMIHSHVVPIPASHGTWIFDDAANAEKPVIFDGAVFQFRVEWAKDIEEQVVYRFIFHEKSTNIEYRFFSKQHPEVEAYATHFEDNQPILIRRLYDRSEPHVIEKFVHALLDNSDNIPNFARDHVIAINKMQQHYFESIARPRRWNGQITWHPEL